MRSETNQTQSRIPNSRINQDQIRFDMAVSVAFPRTNERVIAVFRRERPIIHKHIDQLWQNICDVFVKGIGFCSLVVAPESGSLLNCPHSGQPSTHRWTQIE